MSSNKFKIGDLVTVKTTLRERSYNEIEKLAAALDSTYQPNTQRTFIGYRELKGFFYPGVETFEPDYFSKQNTKSPIALDEIYKHHKFLLSDFGAKLIIDFWPREENDVVENEHTLLVQFLFGEEPFWVSVDILNFLKIANMDNEHDKR